MPLTVFQTITLDGILMITSPQELVSLIVSKAVNMAEMMNIPVLGLIENYSYVTCPHCGERPICSSQLPTTASLKLVTLQSKPV